MGCKVQIQLEARASCKLELNAWNKVKCGEKLLFGPSGQHLRWLAPSSAAMGTIVAVGDLVADREDFTALGSSSRSSSIPSHERSADTHRRGLGFRFLGKDRNP